MAGVNVAIAGATGAVGQAFRSILEPRDFPIARIRFLASARSKGKKLTFRGAEIEVEELTPDAFEKDEIVLSSAGGSTSKWFAPEAAKQGAIVIDNTSAFRMEPDVPLVVPEINARRIKDHKGIIANPNCSTIQMVHALEPIHRLSPLQRIVVSTYQSTSGKGAKAMEELKEQTRAWANDSPMPKPEQFPHQIAFNCLPHIDRFLDDGFTFEEEKMMNETRKIMEAENIKVNATTVRVPVFRGHAESVYVETEKPLAMDAIRKAWSEFPNLIVIDDPANNKYPLQVDCQDREETFVGRLRKDRDYENGFVFWVVSDNLWKGAALNAIQIAEELVKQGLVPS